MFLRALFAFLALPGIVAFAVPVYWLVATSRTELAQPLGLLALVLKDCFEDAMKPATIDEYIATFSPDIQEILRSSVVSQKRARRKLRRRQR